MKIDKIKPIPKYILAKIKKIDKEFYSTETAQKRFYAYLTKNDKELVKITVCCKNHKKKWFCKQVAVHGINSNKCFVKDMAFHYASGYTVGWYSEGLYKHPRWSDYRNWGYTEDKLFDPCAYVINPEYALTFDEYKYSAVDKFNRWETLNYLKLYKQYPEIEYLTKIGLPSYIILSKSILNKMKKDNKFRKFIIHNINIIKNKHPKITTIIYAYNKNKTLDEAIREQWYINFYKDKASKEIRSILTNNQNKIIKYITENSISQYSYRDYLIACNTLHIDLNINKNLIPKDFNYWHDTRILEMQAKLKEIDEEKKKEKFKLFKEIANKYIKLENSNNIYAIIIAKSPEELKKEGETLNHCVGRMGYDEKFIKEQSLIFFVREHNEINKSLVTVEYSIKDNDIIQCHGINNSRPNEDILNYLYKEWIPFAKKQIKKTA